MSFVGTWSYRSLINNPDLSVDFNALQFGKGTMVLTEPQPGKVGGTLGGPGWSLDLSGTTMAGAPVSIRFQGKGEISGETWIYDYLGYIVPIWPHGIDQIDTIVGTLVRAVPHSGGTAKAGYVATWYAVRQ